MPEEMLNSLAWDAIGGEAGSWLDPFFPGPAPIGDLPGMGDRYRDLSFLGEGATARVYRALDTLLQRQVAIKVLKDPGGSSLVEARAQARVEHPHICRIYEVGKGFIVMQLVEGPTLAHLAPALGFEDKLRIIRDVALGVHAAHQKGLIHLDLKLNNVLVQTGEEGTQHPVVSDFGMVRGEASDPARGCPMGTPPYTSPEQLGGDIGRLSRRTDVYGLGVMLYVLLAGVIPFEIHTFPELLDAILHAPPVPLRQRLPELPRDLARIVQRCLEKDPEARYATAKEFADDLERFLRAEPVDAMGGGRLYRAAKWLHRNRKLRWAGGIALALLFGTAVVMAQRNQFLAQQAEWDHHFQKTVEEMRTALDQTYRLPPHDIEGELQGAQALLGTLDGERARGGRPAQGPAYLALGQAQFLLDAKAPMAVTYLQKAWDTGYRVESGRAWLALALIRRYQAERRAILSTTADADTQRLQLESCRQRLQQARRLLVGRSGPDQARLTHLLELAEAASSDITDYDKQIYLARTYRARFPNDLEGMLEEAEALGAKADDLAQKAANSPGVYPPPCGSQVEPLRQAAGDILRQLARIAPSHPGVYAALAQWNQRQSQWPTERTPSSALLYEQTRKWLDAGLTVCPHSTQLISQYAMFLSNQELLYRLERGLDLAPLKHRMQTLFRLTLTEAGRLSHMEVAAAMCQYILACSAFDKPASFSLPEITQAMLRDPVPTGGLSPLLFGPTIGRLLLESGQDPRPCLGEFLGAKAPADDLESIACASMNLILAEHAWLTGQGAGSFLDAADLCLKTLKPYAMLRGELELSSRLLRAQTTGSVEAWTRVEETIGQMEHASSNQVLTQVYTLEARIALARRRVETGLDAGALLKNLRTCLEHLDTDKRIPKVYRDQCMASVSLLEAQGVPRPVPLLLEGLAALDQVVRATASTPGLEARRRRPPGASVVGAFPGRIQKTRGELMLVLAKVDKGPGARSRWASRAVAAFQRALRLNSNLRRHIAPLLLQAQVLLPSHGDSRAPS